VCNVPASGARDSIESLRKPTIYATERFSELIGNAVKGYINVLFMFILPCFLSFLLSMSLKPFCDLDLLFIIHQARSSINAIIVNTI
jgi:hypothetical protein